MPRWMHTNLKASLSRGVYAYICKQKFIGQVLLILIILDNYGRNDGCLCLFVSFKFDLLSDKEKLKKLWLNVR